MFTLTASSLLSVNSMPNLFLLEKKRDERIGLHSEMASIIWRVTWGDVRVY